MDPAAILELYAGHGRRSTGAGLPNRLHHAWQCARLARNAGASPSLQLAAWLHELGDLLAQDDAGPFGTVAHAAAAAPGPSAAERGAALLEPLFGAAVARPVGLQRRALRCLASSKPDVRRRLGAAAHAQLQDDGGLLTPSEARAFLQVPMAPQAIRLCLWDLDAQDPELRPPSLDGALDTMRRLMWLLQTSASLRSSRWSSAVRGGSRASAGLATG
jgi:predicted HD phosphohydrolase